MQDVCVAEPVGLVEEQQDDHLVRAHVELVPLLPKGRPHVCAAGGSSAAARGAECIQHSSGAAAALEAYLVLHMHPAGLIGAGKKTLALTAPADVGTESHMQGCSLQV